MLDTRPDGGGNNNDGGERRSGNGVSVGQKGESIRTMMQLDPFNKRF